MIYIKINYLDSKLTGIEYVYTTSKQLNSLGDESLKAIPTLSDYTLFEIHS